MSEEYRSNNDAEIIRNDGEDGLGNAFSVEDAIVITAELNTLSAKVKSLEAERDKAKADNTELRKRLQFCTDLVVKAEAERDSALAANKLLASRLAADHRFSEAPCLICDYNGPGYFQPETHSCSKMFHAAMDKRNHATTQREVDDAATDAAKILD